jgi:hypothetical protein
MLFKVLEEDRRKATALQAVIAAGVLNYVVHGVIAGLIGGDAWTGGPDAAGRYFLRSHGHLTAVSHAVFLYSWWHNALTIAAFTVAIGAAIWLRDLTDRAKRARYASIRRG